MDTDTKTAEAAVDQIYSYAANLLVKQKRDPYEVVEMLKREGMEEESAHIVVNNLTSEVRRLKKARARKDMLWGAVWCVGGLVATVANIGFIFWGAILFGGIQFFRGVANSGG